MTFVFGYMLLLTSLVPVAFSCIQLIVLDRVGIVLGLFGRVLRPLFVSGLESCQGSEMALESFWNRSGIIRLFVGFVSLSFWARCGIVLRWSGYCFGVVGISFWDGWGIVL